jgi:hypothetical protein
VKIHILRPESITPISLYIERQQNRPESYKVQLEFATVLLYREREYRAMNSAKWFAGKTPAPTVESPFQPFDITPDAAADLASILADRAPELGLVSKNDLFGLKDSAADGLRRVLRPVKPQRLGWLVYASVLTDLCRYEEAVVAADEAAGLGERVQGSALAGRAALLGGLRRGHIETDRALSRAVDALEERIRQAALRIRKSVEGPAFSRFLSTSTAFCEEERDRALESFDESRVPANLRALVPLARQLGVGDEGCRAMFMSRMRARDRREAANTVRAHGQAIDDWLSSIGPPPYECEAAAFFWLRAAADDLDS